ncbi:chemotaxis response regulator protein-glutamate methylesterase [Parvularcula sp. LCG005]|uniref:protein-glutamate methylesterase/protein-glutamine glutaminase n=1 Tax=Parvularcula sp. LCG005 TaxID=3078805 RepID=UPI00294380A5|nr:chemotaxis response regulator protein-glutamate methylesterase [Parvularcula sp. LCG005]WOI52620.1 chemotaxis response regulator protein-glutamate methylesterase [Parvularcula sp. LCG005]
MSIRVLVVDDSPTMRGLISAVLSRDPQIEVVGSAGDPYEAREAIKTLLPDVITLDVEMPRMDGLSFLEKIMTLRPMPVIMVSTLTGEGAYASVKALSLGAFDCIAKPANNSAINAFEKLPELVKAASKAKIVKYRGGPDVAEPLQFTPTRETMIAIGSSTGGVEALTEVLRRFPENCPATVITQHMPERFTESFAKRLDGICAPGVHEAQDGMPIQSGNVYIAPGGAHHLTVHRAGGLVCRVQPGPLVNGHHPSVDVLFSSVAKTIGANAVGAILTGMGRDGAEGLLEMKKAGAQTIGQDETSCVVYGMPRAAHEIGATEKEYPIERIAGAILSRCQAGRRQNAA